MSDDDQILPKHLSDEAAAQMVELLYQLALALESRYLGEIIRYHRNNNPRQQNLRD